MFSEKHVGEGKPAETVEIKDDKYKPGWGLGCKQLPLHPKLYVDFQAHHGALPDAQIWGQDSNVARLVAGHRAAPSRIGLLVHHQGLRGRTSKRLRACLQNDGDYRGNASLCRSSPPTWPHCGLRAEMSV